MFTFTDRSHTASPVWCTRDPERVVLPGGGGCWRRLAAACCWLLLHRVMHALCVQVTSRLPGCAPPLRLANGTARQVPTAHPQFR